MYSIFVAAILFVGAWAQRPSNASICDYYAMNLYGANTTATQYRLIQGIISLAFGGPGTLTNVSSNLTGILNNGTFQGTPVDLHTWFDGSKDSTNLNNQPVGINWLDGGGRQPLWDFTSGATTNVIISNTTNEYRLFAHFFSAFAHVFGCSQPTPLPPSSGGGFLSLAYVHKFMDLNHTDIGHFIDQISLSGQYFGFSLQDSQTFSDSLNAQYNVRCSPPVINPALGPQLYSLCQDPSCPLAAPSPDCADYVNILPSGIASGTNSVQSSTATSTSSSSSTSTSISSSTTTATTSAATTSASNALSTSTVAASSTLPAGGIAGVAIGGAALLFAFIAALVWLLRRRAPEPQMVQHPYVPPSNPSYTNHTSYISGVETVGTWNSPPAEMESPQNVTSPKMGSLSPL